jgi:hypothetical protein
VRARERTSPPLVPQMPQLALVLLQILAQSELALAVFQISQREVSPTRAKSVKCSKIPRCSR